MRYRVERTAKTGQWHCCVTTDKKSLALTCAAGIAHWRKDRRRVTVRVVDTKAEGPPYIAGWINGGPAWGDAFRVGR